MWSIAQVAERDRVSKPTVSVRVKRFVEQHRLTVERDPMGRVARLNVAEYDALRNRFDDPSKAQAPPATAASATPAPPEEDSESYNEALRQKTWIATERDRINLDRERGRLVDTQSVAEGYDRAATAIRSVLERLDDHADDLAAIMVKDGARGLNSALKKIGAELLGEIANALSGEGWKLRSAIAEKAAKSLQ